MSCRTCPAAFLIEGAAPGDRAVLCRVESTERGVRSAKAGPVSIVRERTSPASLHSFCLGDLARYAAGVELLGPLATEEQRRIAAAVRASGSGGADYTGCPSWRDERENSAASKLVDLPGQRRKLPRAA